MRKFRKTKRSHSRRKRRRVHRVARPMPGTSLVKQVRQYAGGLKCATGKQAWSCVVFNDFFVLNELFTKAPWSELLTNYTIPSITVAAGGGAQTIPIVTLSDSSYALSMRQHSHVVWGQLKNNTNTSVVVDMYKVRPRNLYGFTLTANGGQGDLYYDLTTRSVNALGYALGVLDDAKTDIGMIRDQPGMTLYDNKYVTSKWKIIKHRTITIPPGQPHDVKFKLKQHLKIPHKDFYQNGYNFTPWSSHKSYTTGYVFCIRGVPVFDGSSGSQFDFGPAAIEWVLLERRAYSVDAKKLPQAIWQAADSGVGTITAPSVVAPPVSSTTTTAVIIGNQ